MECGREKKDKGLRIKEEMQRLVDWKKKQTIHGLKMQMRSKNDQRQRITSLGKEEIVRQSSTFTLMSLQVKFFILLFMGASGSGTKEEMVNGDEEGPKPRSHTLSCSFHVSTKARQDDGKD